MPPAERTAAKPPSPARHAAAAQAARMAAEPPLPKVVHKRVREEVLPNGVRILMNSRPGAPAMNIAIGTAAGAMQDPPGKEGAAHLFEHLAFQGTPRRDKQHIWDTMQQLGGAGNAGTSLSEVVYEVSAPAGDAARAARLFADMYRNPNTQPKHLRHEKQVVQQEMRARYGDRQMQAHLELSRLLYGKDPWGRAPAGTPDSVSKITTRDVAEWTKRHHTGANTVVLLDGDPKQFPLKQIRSSLGQLNKGKRAEDPSFGGFQPGAKLQLIPHTGDAQANVSIALPNLTQVKGVLDADAQALSDLMQQMSGSKEPGISSGLAGQVLANVLSDRVNDRMREEELLTYGAGASFRGGAGEVLQIGTDLDPKNLRKGVAALASELKEVARGVSAAEVRRAREQLVNEIALGADHPSTAAARRFSAALEGQAGAPGPRDIMKATRSVTARDVRSMAELFLSDLSHAKIVASGSVRGSEAEIRAGLADAGVKIDPKRVPFPRSRYERQIATR